jgi:protein SCO1
MKKYLLIIGLFALLCSSPGYAHEKLETGNGDAADIGITERLRETIPGDISFYDENGQKIKLADMLGKPVILALVYYTCERICPQLLAGMAEALPRLAMTAGRDYRVVSASFDASDTPQIARSVKRNYVKAAGASFPAGAWEFLTADAENIHRLTESVGFRFRKDSHGFTHPVVLIFLSPEGKISRYFSVTKYEYGAAYPISFSSFDLNMALTEAAQGKPVTELRKAILYCFSHEPPGQSKFFYFISIIGLITILAMISFFVYLQVTSNKYRKDLKDGQDK